MDTIKVNNIRLYAYHGCLEEERKIGSDYSVDISVDTDFSKSAQSDDLSDTVDYVAIHQIVLEEMRAPSNLLETVAERIIIRILQLSLVEKVKVDISKLNPPIGGDVASVTISMTKERNNN